MVKLAQNENGRWLLRLEGEEIPVRLRRLKTRNLRLRLNRKGELSISLPPHLSLREVEAFVSQHLDWLETSRQKLARLRDRLSPPFELRDGAALPVLDHTVRLVLQPEENLPSRWQQSDGRLILRGRFTPEQTCRVVVQWYRATARAFLLERVPQLAEPMGVRYKKIRVGNQRSLWGSCSRRGTLSFNWRIVLLAPDTADYLIIHELAHLLQPNHSPKFWEIVARFCPEFRRHKKILRERSFWLDSPACETTI